MAYDPMRHHRRSIRLAGYDYADRGVYYVTICAWRRECIFGEVVNGVMQLNDLGRIVNDEWMRTASLRSDVATDEHIIMPNHMHGIVALHRGMGTARRAPTVERFGKPTVGSVPTIVPAFKAASARAIDIMQQTPASPVWQRNYYEHIIRTDAELMRTRVYVQTNPLHWLADPDYPTSAAEA